MGDPEGSYRRRIRTVTLEPGVVWGGLEDDFHHFEVTIRHDGATVTDLDMEAWRWPWATCPTPAGPLRSLIGMELSERCTAVAEVMDPPHVLHAPVRPRRPVRLARGAWSSTCGSTTSSCRRRVT